MALAGSAIGPLSSQYWRVTAGMRNPGSRNADPDITHARR